MADKYSVEAAEILANEALRLPLSEAVPIYEQLLATFPTAAKYWKQYVEAHMAVNNDDATKQIFSRCLLNCLQIPLWRCYIRFIRKVNEKKGVEGQEETRKAYDFMLGYVGADIASGPVWMEYIMFLKSMPNNFLIFVHFQCLMYLYHYPDIWYDYATWHAKSGSVDSAIKVFHRALKALPDSEVLKYAFAELEESRGAIQPAKKVYESLLGDGVNATALSHIQYIRFLRRTEGVEAARKYFLDARKSPNCTYHVYVAYAMMAFCLDKDPKIAHNVFEAGLKRFMHEPGYILEYADFLSRLNDDRNIRALFERALSSLPPEESVEVWKRFTQFEQTYGDLASMLKVEQRRKEALARAGEENQSALESSLQDVISRYSFMDLWPCSSKDLDHLARQEWLSNNVNKKIERSALANGAVILDKGSSGMTTNSNPSAKVVYPDTSRMLIYDPRQKSVPSAPGLPAVSSTVTASSVALIGGGTTNAPNEFLKATPPALLAFIANLPVVEGPSPDVDFVLSVCLQSNIPTGQTGKSATPSIQLQTGPAPCTSDLSGSSKPHPVQSGSSFKTTRDRQPGKKRDRDRQDDDETSTVQSQPLPRDMFKIRQLRKARGVASQTGSTSYGSAFSGELSGSTG
ncbi:Cleavage stimulation factor subunit like [Actinidia chinensis var. chinensis]|uniref:Cleavage stimulation factor subunit like n=1 Tax=Actinidia chinensis var. chinensis TaxID=1590841 RepID=A0A2R6RHB1_ACTCC|nr:Cleavage stimulation factor subunit like [Actinidia chinensis var. chinensis]